MGKTSTPSPPAVLFDFGDTLVHFGNVDRKAAFRKATWRTYHVWAKRSKRMPDYRRFYLHHWFALRWSFLKTILLRREMDTMRILQRASSKLWLRAPADFFNELVWHWYRPLVDVATVEDGTADVLQQLIDQGYQLAIVSNTFVPGFALDRHLAKLDLLKYFPVRIYSCDVGYRKPSRHIFNIALDRLGTPARRAVFVGDLLDADVRGAKRAGMQAVWRRPPDTPYQTPDHTHAIDSLHELPDLLSELID